MAGHRFRAARLTATSQRPSALVEGGKRSYLVVRNRAATRRSTEGHAAAPSNRFGVPSITLRYDERPFTANAARSASHWSVTAKLTAKWREAFRLLALEAGVADLGPTVVTVTPYLRDRRGRQDTGACFPAAKAAVDGICDAGAWPDDTAAYVVEVRFRPPIYGEGDGLVIELAPITAPALGGPHIHCR
jgi:hypothetical protein